MSAEQWSLGYPIPSVPLPQRFSAWGQRWPQEHLHFRQAMNPSPYKAHLQWLKAPLEALGMKSPAKTGVVYYYDC